MEFKEKSEENLFDFSAFLLNLDSLKLIDQVKFATCIISATEKWCIRYSARANSWYDV